MRLKRNIIDKLNTQLTYEAKCMPTHKQCTVCKEDKNISEYYFAKRKIDNHENICKSCDKEKSMTRHNNMMKDPDYRQEQMNRWKRYKDRQDPLEMKMLARVQKHNRRALAKNAGHYTAKEARDLVASSNGECYWCESSIEEDDMHLDHYYPLSKGGSNNIDNIVVSCSHCNLSKGDKDPEEFARRVGRLM